MNDRFVCAINRGRDGYQVPLALYEAGLLASFVTDFYAPDRPSRRLPEVLRRRHVRGLPAAAVETSRAAFLVQVLAEVARLPMAPTFRICDRFLQRKAANVARREQAHLYCYSPFLPQNADIAPGTIRAIFEFHPLPELPWELLLADRARYPQVEQSFQEERRNLQTEAITDVWKRADAISCASSFTKRSLVHAGCDPARITVVPYGIDAPRSLPDRDANLVRPGMCKFLFVGQGMQRKGLHHLIEAWQAEHLAGAQLTLVCYRIDPGIRAMIRDPSITLLERQSAAELDQLYREADVFVMPSLVEGFGLVYLEALAHGCHVIGTENSGLPDLQLPSEAATLVPASDLEAIAAALRSCRDMMLAGQVARSTVIEAARRWQWSDFRAGIADHARGLLDT